MSRAARGAKFGPEVSDRSNGRALQLLRSSRLRRRASHATSQMITQVTVTQPLTHATSPSPSWLDLSLQYGARSRNVGLSILFISEFEERGVRKVTTGITGLWLPSVHSDIAF